MKNKNRHTEQGIFNNKTIMKSMFVTNNCILLVENKKETLILTNKLFVKNK